MTDVQLVEALSKTSTDQQRLEALKFLYSNQKVRQQLKGYVLKNKGNLEDAKDVWQGAIIELAKSIRAGNFKAESTLSGYLFGIGRNIWQATLRKNSQLVTQDQMPIEIEEDNPETILLKEEKKVILEEILAKLGPPCDKILLLKGQEKSHEEIAKEMGYAKADNAKKRTYRCRQRLRTLFQEHPQYLKLLKE